MHYSTYTRDARRLSVFLLKRHPSPIVALLLLPHTLETPPLGLGQHRTYGEPRGDAHDEVRTPRPRRTERADEREKTPRDDGVCGPLRRRRPPPRRLARTSFGNTSAATTYGTGPNEQLKLRR